MNKNDILTEKSGNIAKKYSTIWTNADAYLVVINSRPGVNIDQNIVAPYGASVRRFYSWM